MASTLAIAMLVAALWIAEKDARHVDKESAFIYY